MVYRNFSSDLRHLVSDVLKVIEIKINIDAYDPPPPLYLSVIGQVVGTVHELLQGAPRPVGPLVAGGQLLGRWGSSIAHVQGGFPRGAPLHVPPLAEVARHGVPQQSDVVELSIWGQGWSKREERKKSRGYLSCTEHLVYAQLKF